MSLLIGFLTFILVVNCLFLMLLVLVQLPKKEAGSGLAFGAGAVDTLIGAGSGNALTRMTKYSAGTFLGLAVVLAVLNSHRSDSSSRLLREELSRKAAAGPVLPVQPAQTPTGGTPAGASPEGALQQTPVTVPDNQQSPAAPSPATPDTP